MFVPQQPFKPPLQCIMHCGAAVTKMQGNFSLTQQYNNTSLVLGVSSAVRLMLNSMKTCSLMQQ